MKLTNQITGATPFFYFLEAIDYIAKKNWLEGDSGSLSMLMDISDIWPYVTDAYNPEEYPLKMEIPELSEQFILLTGDKIPLRNVAKFKFKIHRMLGIIQINATGDGYRIVWGFQDGCRPTRFLKSHLLIHNERKKVDSHQQVLIHAFPKDLVQKTFLDHLENENQFTYDIWNAMPAFATWAPEGIGLASVSEGNKFYQNASASVAIAQKFQQYRVVTLKYHGVVVSGNDWDDVITLMESLDKAAANATRLLKEEKYAFKPSFFQSLAKKQKLTLNPLVLKYGNLPKTQIFEPEKIVVEPNTSLDEVKIEEVKAYETKKASQ